MTHEARHRGLIETVDRLEFDLAAPTLDDLRAAGVDEDVIQAAIADLVLLVDQRLRLDLATGAFHPITPCRLNRQHPAVRAIAGGG